MLTKLTKYEFTTAVKTYLPFYGIILLFALLNRFSVRFNYEIFYLPQGLVMMAYIMLLTGLAVVTFLMGILRFKKNLLGDEGYLMFTLPAQRWQLVMAKVISSVVWSIAAVLVGVLSIFIVAVDKTFITEFSKMMGNADFSAIGVGPWSLVLYILGFIIMALLGLSSRYIIIYLSMSLGHMSNKNKLVMSFGWYFVVNFAWQMLTTVVGAVGGKMGVFDNMFETQSLGTALMIGIAYMLLVNGLSFFGITFVLQHKLNLE